MFVTFAADELDALLNVADEEFAEAGVNRPQGLPDRQEAALLLREIGFVGERRPETQDLQLDVYKRQTLTFPISGGRA